MPKTRFAVSGPSIHAIDRAINAIAFTPNSKALTHRDPPMKQTPPKGIN